MASTYVEYFGSCFKACRVKNLENGSIIICAQCHWEQIPAKCMAICQDGTRCRADLFEHNFMYCHRHKEELYKDHAWERARFAVDLKLAQNADFNENPEKVYFIECDGFIKIGRSIHPEQRLKTLKSASDGTIKPIGMNMENAKILKTIGGGSQTEKHLHWRFEQWRSDGEWFKASKELLDYIEGC